MDSQSTSATVHGILIAAGASKRLGQPKQLIRFKGKNLINYTSDVLSQSDLTDLKIVLGCQAEVIGPLISSEHNIIINENWASGMGSSISCGARTVADTTDGILISLVDQYHMTSDLIDSIITEFKKDSNNLIISRYGNGFYGPPAIFPKRMLDDLKVLSGDRGAGKLIKEELSSNSNQVIIVEFEKGHLDIDVPEDLLNLAE